MVEARKMPQTMAAIPISDMITPPRWALVNMLALAVLKGEKISALA